jgi:hypothetical protein
VQLALGRVHAGIISCLGLACRATRGS